MLKAGRSQLVIYAVIGVVLLLVGINSLRGRDETGGGVPVGADRTAGSQAGDPSDPSGSAGSADSGFALSSANSKLVVDVSGGVRRPGVYHFPEGSRVIDAIERAGGPVGRALPGAINRAAKLADGQQVVVPLMAAAAGPGSAGGAGGAAGPASAADVAGTAVTTGAAIAGAGAPISLGTATPEQLEEIDGIGPVTAASIIEFRDQQGGVASVDELDQVSGIGPVTMEALRSGLQP